MRTPELDTAIKAAKRDFGAALFLWRVYEPVIPPWVVAAVNETARRLEDLGVRPLDWETNDA